MSNARQVPPSPFGRGVLNGPTDYVPEWDVPSIGQRPTSDLFFAIEAIDGSLRVDPERKIQVLLGPPGYGKTHLFGRLAHRLGDRVLFVFIPPFQDLRRPLAHIRHHVVMSLFEESTGGRSRLARILAGLCRLSFVEYLGHLPRPLDARYAELLGRLKTDERAVLEIVDTVKTLPPFRRVGDSLQAKFPQLNGRVLHALALGWSLEKELACRWLRGESITEEHARRLGLPEDAPDPSEVIKAVAVLTAGQTPVILCVDQLDTLLADKESAPLQFSSAMMTLRSEIPNLLIVLSCLKGEWADLADRCLATFKDRTVTHDLDRLTEEQAAELVRLRLKAWGGDRAGKTEWWPIDEPSLRGWLASTLLLRPRGLLKDCDDRYEEWLEQGDLARPITFGAPIAADPLADFRREWEKELAEAEKDPRRAPEKVQDQRLARALKEGIGLLANRKDAPVTPKILREDPIPQVKGNPDPYRYTFEIGLEGQEGAKAILIALEVNHNASKLNYFFRAIVDELDATTVGAVLITPKTQLSAGAATKVELETETKNQRVRIISLPDYRQDFARLECFLALLDQATAQNLQLAGTTVDAPRCRELVARSGELNNLSLFDRILDGWGTVASGQKTCAAPSPVPSREASPAEPTPPAREVSTGTVDSPAAPPVSTEPLGEITRPLDELSVARLLWAAEGQDLVMKRLGELGARVRPTGFGAHIGPTFARFLMTPFPATTIGKIRSRAEDLKVGLNVETLPLVSSQAGAISVDVQLPEQFRRSVRLADMGPGPAAGLPAFPVGQDVTGEKLWLDLSDPNTCHLLVAGTTGSGKSEFLKAMITALARRLGPDRIAFALIDPKQVTFNFGDERGPYLIRPVANGADEALAIVKDCFVEAERRFSELKNRKLEDIAQWQSADPHAPPRLVLVFDEYADLMADAASKKELEGLLKRLGGKARAAGIHVILATQRPEATVVTPLLRSNLPARVCFRVASPADSKLLLKSPDGADLLGRGDLIWQRGAGTVRLQSPYVERAELEAALFPSKR